MEIKWILLIIVLSITAVAIIFGIIMYIRDKNKLIKILERELELYEND